MRARRVLALGLTSFGVLGVSAVLAQGEGGPGRLPLDPGVVAVRLLLGVGDREPQSWGGRVAVDRGEVVGVEGYRFRAGDKVTGRDAWEARSRLIRKAAAQKKAGAQPVAKKTSGTGTVGPTVTPNGVVVSLKAPKDATLAVATDHGKFHVPLAELADGSVRTFLDGRVAAQRVATHAALVEGPEQEDFPAAAGDGKGGAWVAYVVHSPRGPEILEAFTERPKHFADFAPKGGGDQIRLLHFADGRAGEPLDVTGPGLDVGRPVVVQEHPGRVVVAWSQNVGGNWDLYRRDYNPERKTWSDVKRLTTDPGADTDVVLAEGEGVGVGMAWQGWRDGKAIIFFAWADDTSDPIPLSDPGANAWSPALVFNDTGNAFVAYDTYQAGNYDVQLCRLHGPVEDPVEQPALRITIASSPLFEARPSVAVDPKGRVWVAYEERTANWGKDAENLLEGKGSSLYRESRVRVRCLDDDDRVLEPADPLEHAPNAVRAMNGFPRLACDREGRVWLAFRHRQEAVWGNNAVMVVGGVWVEYVTSLSGKAWSPPQPLPRSDGLLDNRPALVTFREDPLLVFYNTDARLHHEVEFTPESAWKYYSHSGTPPGVVNNDIQVAAVTPVAKLADPVLSEPTAKKVEVESVHPHEADDVARVRDYRIKAGGKTYRLLRGDFHRHTEISQDGGSDGALEDMWRYAIDVARLDWMGNNDHDNGGGKEYTWWLVQKSTDLHNSPRLATLFTYERSVSYPHGHRNVMFPKRGVRTLPRLVENGQVTDADTLMLYDYLKEHGGICASHTTATGMGTDWRDVNPEFEPFVEIYQGHRNSYEHLGAPRVARRPGEAIGGWKPLGMVWNALALQYRVGFQASSDHISTHISYAVAVAEEATREGVFEAFKKRHCYGATDNIVLDVRSGDHLMGDEFEADGAVRLKVVAHGTRPIARVDVIKDFAYVYSTEPNRERVEFSWTDDEKRPGGLSWYYVRVRQDDGELAWGSPLWVHQRPAGRE